MVKGTEEKSVENKLTEFETKLDEFIGELNEIESNFNYYNNKVSKIRESLIQNEEKDEITIDVEDSETIKEKLIGRLNLIYVDQIYYELKEIKKFIPETLCSKFKYLTEDEIFAHYESQIKGINYKIDEIDRKKMFLKQGFKDLLKDFENVETILFEQNNVEENDLVNNANNSEESTNIVADFYNIINSEAKEEFGMINELRYIAGKTKRSKKTLLNMNSIPAVKSEYLLSNKFNIPFEHIRIEENKKSDEKANITVEINSFSNSKSSRLSLDEKNQIGQKKSKLKSLKEDVEKNSKKFEKEGVIVLKTIDSNKSFAISITQKELILKNLDPKALKWETIDQFKKRKDENIDTQYLRMDKLAKVNDNILKRFFGKFFNKK